MDENEEQEEERRIGRAVVRSSDRARELEVASEVVIKERKAEKQAAMDKVDDRMNNMATLAMDALEMGMQSEDEGIRMKALAMYLDRRAPRVGIVREAEVVEIIDEGKKLSLEEIELLLKKKGMLDGGDT